MKGGVAEADGRLMAGDQILQVNNEDMRNSTQEQAAAILKVTFVQPFKRNTFGFPKFISSRQMLLICLICLDT